MNPDRSIHQLMYSRRFILYGLSILAVAIGTILWIRTFGAHRPYINWDPYDLAQYIVNNQRSPEECWDLVVLDPFGPQAAIRRAGCVFKIAELSANPSVCTLILPSEYGLACLSNIAGSLTIGFGCAKYKADDTLYCSSGLRAKYIGIEDCSDYPEQETKDWCFEERTRTLKGVHECNHISSNPPELREECERWYAFKERDPSLCSSIQDEKRRVLCEVKINAWLQYPELRNSFYFGTTSPSPTTTAQ